MISNITFSSSFKKQFRKYGENEKFKKKWKKFYNELLSRELVDLHPQWKNHKLGGKYTGFREVHIFLDVLLIYEIKGELYILSQIGNHSDLFG